MDDGRMILGLSVGTNLLAAAAKEEWVKDFRILGRMLTPGRDICQEANLRHTWAKSVVSATSTTRDGLKETKKVSADPLYELPMLII